jgi:hypothetical protein
MVGFCLRLLCEDIQNGMTMLEMITPKAVDTVINQQATIKYQTVAEIDADLAKRGLRPVREFFEIDYKNTPATMPGSELVTEAEIIPPPNQTVDK